MQLSPGRKWYVYILRINNRWLGAKIICVSADQDWTSRKLASAGTTTLEKRLEAGSAKNGRDYISRKPVIQEKLILPWVKLEDLFRIKGVAEKHSNLLEAAGVDKVAKLWKRVPDNFRQRCQKSMGPRRLPRVVQSYPKSNLGLWLQRRCPGWLCISPGGIWWR